MPRKINMTETEQSVVAACADTMFPPAGPIPVSGTEAGLVAYVDAYLAALPLPRRLLVRALFMFIQLSPYLFGPRRKRFTSLRPADRTGALADMASSPAYFRRVAFLSMRTIMTMGYFACPLVVSRVLRQQGKVSS